MELKGIKIGFALTGSFCTFKKVIPKMKELINQGAEIIPIMSFNSYNLDTKFGKAKDFIKEDYSYNSRSGTNWTKKDDRYYGYCTMFSEIQFLSLLVIL